MPPPGIDDADYSQDAPQRANASEPVIVGSPRRRGIGTADAPPVLGGGMPSRGAAGPRGCAWATGSSADLTTGASAFIIVLVVLVAIFLLIKSIPSIADDKVNFLTSTEWSPTQGNLRFGVAPLLYTTVLVSLIALVLAVPVAIGIGLFITQYAPKRLARPVAYVVDLLAAIPSIIYGIWGYSELAPKLAPVQRALYHLGGPLFSDQGVLRGSVFDGGVVLAVMILPIITAISRDVFERTPRANKEAALALGSTKWEMIRMTVLPYGRPGVVSGAMLGLGRALGETIAVLLILSKVSNFSFSIFSGGETFASKIANNQAEFNNPSSTGAYIAAGLVLFVLTFLVNAAARSDRQPAQGVRVTAPPLRRAPPPRRSSESRPRGRLKNNLATVLVTLAFGVALVPLVWLLWTVIGKGWHVVVHAGWWTGTQRNKTYSDAGGGALHAIVGTLEQVALCTVISVPIAILVGVYLVEYGARAAGPDRDVHGGHPHRHPVDRGGAVHLRGVHRVLRRPWLGLAGLARAGDPDGPGDRAHDRGNAAAGAERIARGVLCARHPEVEDDRAGGAADGHDRA